MVLKAGKIVCFSVIQLLNCSDQTLQEEYDTPSNLLKNPNGLLRALVDESGERDKLVDMAQSSSRSSLS
jgi:hypothetical protein